MFLSVFDIFKVGIGPSSSHTMGPMTAAARFLDDLRGGAEPIPGAGRVAALKAWLHGSLAFTGKGHATDRAVILGLSGHLPDTIDPDAAEAIEAEVRRSRQVTPAGLPPLAFDPATDLVFDFGPPLPLHANGMVLAAYDRDGRTWRRETYYSVGGGFVLTEAELKAQRDRGPDMAAEQTAQGCPSPFASAREMLAMGHRTGLSIAAMKRANETAVSGRGDLDARLDAL